LNFLNETQKLHSDNCTLLSYYTVSSGNFLPTFQDNLSVPSPRFKNILFLNPQDRTYKLSQNVSKKLPLLTV